MSLPSVDHVIGACKSHIHEAELQGSEMESYLADYLLVVVCAAFEEEIERLIQDRIRKSKDKSLESLCMSCISAVFRSVKSSEIAGLLNRFGEEYKTLFASKLKDNEAAVSRFNNIVINRHKVAHSEGSNMTFEEVVRSYSEGSLVLNALSETLDATLQA